MNKTILMIMLVGVFAATMITSTVVTSDVSASTCPPTLCGSDDVKKDRTNNNLDKHIAKGGAHGAEAQKIRDDGRPCPTCPT
ncbi:MAG: hypothetical protein ACRD8W_23850 [Nitrososphaeraceae archaeon]